LLYVQSWTPDDEIYYDARSYEHQKSLYSLQIYGRHMSHP
jgi:hypothetical protein